MRLIVKRAAKLSALLTLLCVAGGLYFLNDKNGNSSWLFIWAGISFVFSVTFYRLLYKNPERSEE